MARERLTKAEAALVNAVCAVAARLPIWDDALIDTMAIVIADVLPDCDRDHPHLGSLVVAAEAIVAWRSLPPTLRGVHARAMQDAAVRVLQWRAALAHDATVSKRGAAA